MLPVDYVTARANRILLVLPSLERGGGERVLLQLARAFLAAGREVHLAVLRGGGPLRAFVPEGVTLHELVAPGSGSKGLALAWQAFPKLVSLMRAIRPDAVLSTMTGTNLLTVLACKRSYSRARLVVREASSLINARGFFKRKAMRWLYRRADMVVVVSSGVAQDLRSLGIPNDQIRVIHNPVDPERLRYLAGAGPVLPNLDGAPYVIALGRLTEAKDHPTLLRAYAASKLRQSHRLVIVGEGEERANLERVIHELGIAERVLLAGPLDNPFRMLAGAALLVLPSRWEGYPNVLLEALALNVPVVATDCQHGPRELLDGGIYGRLVPIGDPIALAHAMDEELVGPPHSADEIVAVHALQTIASCYLAVLDGEP
ncbi:MAG TPA: glycosyltransferase [Rhodanobacter sp.]|jgi:glycosyltransferase involved in cell wall biosynthesis|nr:glycosyltransferase [Rhodanobacter sp.]